MHAHGIFARRDTLGLGWTFSDIAGRARGAAHSKSAQSQGALTPTLLAALAGGATFLLSRKIAMAALVGGAVWFLNREVA